jgi:hypothetical protein
MHAASLLRWPSLTCTAHILQKAWPHPHTAALMTGLRLHKACDTARYGEHSLG